MVAMRVGDDKVFIGVHILFFFVKFCGSFALSLSCVCYAFASVHCCLVIICWERADLLFVMFNCVFVTFLYGILGQVWYLIVSIPDLSCHSYFG